MTNWKQILAPVLVFAMGAICGGGGTALYALKKVRLLNEGAPAETADVGVRRLARRLNLDVPQRVAARPILVEAARELARIRLETIPEMRAALDDAAERLRPILRPNQQRMLDEMLAQPRARWERLAPDRTRPRARALAPEVQP